MNKYSTVNKYSDSTETECLARSHSCDAKLSLFMQKSNSYVQKAMSPRAYDSMLFFKKFNVKKLGTFLPAVRL